MLLLSHASSDWIFYLRQIDWEKIASVCACARLSARMEFSKKHLVGGLTVTENQVLSHATDMFSPARFHRGIERGTYIGIRPITMSSNGPSYEFDVAPRGEQCIQPNLTRLFVQFKVMKGNTVLPANENVSIVNLFASSLFKSFEVDIGGSVCSDLSNTNYNYKSYLE
jgi:hypothetical protein